jgi:hypothetical protein
MGWEGLARIDVEKSASHHLSQNEMSLESPHPIWKANFRDRLALMFEGLRFRLAGVAIRRHERLEETPEGLDCRLFSGADREHDQNQPQQQAARDNGDQPSRLSVIQNRPRHHR